MNSKDTDQTQKTQQITKHTAPLNEDECCECGNSATEFHEGYCRACMGEMPDAVWVALCHE